MPVVASAPLKVYTRPDCSYSMALKFDLDQEGVDYVEIDLSIEPDRVPELEQLTGGEHITPVQVEGDSVIIGYRGVG